MNWKLWLNLITLAVLVLIIFLARDDIGHVFSRLRDLNIVVLALMIPAQFVVFFTLAKLFYHFFAATGVTVSLRKLISPMMELNFVNHVFPSGGVSGFSYLTLRLKPFGVSTAKSTLAQLARFALMFMSFIALLLLALLLLAIDGKTSSLVVLAVSAVTFSLVFATSILIYVIGSERRIAAFTHALARFLNRVIHIFRPKHPETISLRRAKKTFLELHKDYVLIRQDLGRMNKAILWGFLSCVAELVLLYIAFVAHGEWVNPGAVVVAYVIANLVGYIAVLPGGIGLYEPLMTGVLVAAGVSPAVALSATLVYRVITLLLSLLSGFVAYQRAVHKHGTPDVQS
ncbi:MAG TPA: lysylphosphatidylglycerol synthase transmembrane domain-containing protein [Candidatus Saccharimonadales bacterium]|nr:lysylphosphatidylglycerol synthase transmembrane domain-containing protein [Candidatus Saccharimonadales bacterium]